uniref:Endonuclease/exonuclease/phosphatase domain-containing protein n=1 Tax=Rhodosorus marinus TaxID=101924 RepID=A0A7S3A7G3_9RHOD|mmetsp:Transcript_4900/g.21088  ORF Transcript_4900/g.21088 Transcript_4900/m.21088 type:complete len:324 (+) Transcript_4900:139-1110(+)
MESTTMSVATFNVLAPCYRRLDELSVKVQVVEKSGIGPGNFGRRPRPRESQFRDLWSARCSEMCAFVKADVFDVVCLQEFWFDEGYVSKFSDCFMKDYELFSAQRTGGKADGLLTMLRRGKFHVEHMQKLEFKDAGNRVALLLCARLADVGSLLIIVNTHLTFPHHEHDRVLRQGQISKLVEFIDGFVDRHGLENVPVIIGGDMNGDHADPVCAHLRANCFVNSFVQVSGLEDVETHLNHRNERVFVDHIWYRKHIYGSPISGRLETDSSGSDDELRDTHLVPRDFIVKPQSEDLKPWVDDFQLSDHRLVSITFEVEAELSRA